MRTLLTFLVLIFCLQSLTKADNIKDFELEGMSIGDSLLDFMSKSYIDGDKEALYPNKKYLTIFYEFKSEQYDDIQLDFLSKDPKYIIQGVEAKKYFPDNIKGCLSQQKEVSQSVIELTGEQFQESSRPEEMKLGNRWFILIHGRMEAHCKYIVLIGVLKQVIKLN